MKLNPRLERGLWHLALYSSFSEGMLSGKEAEEVAHARQFLLEHFELEDESFLEKGRAGLKAKYGQESLEG